jgi:hypothetical protein
MDEKLVQMWSDGSGDSYDEEYERERLEKESLNDLIDSAITAYYTNDEHINNYIIEEFVQRNGFMDPINQSQYEFLESETHVFGPKVYNASMADKEIIEVFGRKIIFGAFYHPELKRNITWSAVVWDDNYFDEVVSVPEDLQAVDLHDAYQFGEHLESGENYVICEYNEEIIKIEW